jgi:hypothetical protein
MCQEKRTRQLPPSQKPFAGWICNGVLKQGASHRTITDIDYMADWIGADYDRDDMSLKQILSLYHGLACIVYSTTSSTYIARRWRVLSRLNRECTTAEYSGVMNVMQLLSDGRLDSKTKNINRLHYLPATWFGGNNVFHVQDGDLWNVDAMLEICPPQEPTYYDEVYTLEGRKRPDGTEIITANMIEKHMLGAKGGRFFKLLCAAATMHKANGWDLTDTELANAALDVSPVDSNGIRRAMSALREAGRAISYIDSRVQTQTPSERLIQQTRWRLGATA